MHFPAQVLKVLYHLLNAIAMYQKCSISMKERGHKFETDFCIPGGLPADGDQRRSRGGRVRHLEPSKTNCGSYLGTYVIAISVFRWNFAKLLQWRLGSRPNRFRCGNARSIFDCNTIFSTDWNEGYFEREGYLNQNLTHSSHTTRLQWKFQMKIISSLWDLKLEGLIQSLVGQSITNQCVSFAFLTLHFAATQYHIFN